MIIGPHLLDGSTLALGQASGPGPIQLAQRQFAGSLLVQLVCHGVHWPSWGMNMNIGQPEPPLQRTLLDAYGLGLRMGDDVADVGEPTVFGDQGPVVPAIAEGPEVEPPHPARVSGTVQLDGIKIETWQRAPDNQLDFIEGGDRKQHAGGVRLVVFAVALAVAENIDVHPIPA